MSATPLLSLIKKGTFITFQSSAEDMNNVFTQTDPKRKFTFSKFALLNLPDLRPDGYDGTNVMNLNAIEGHYINGLNNISPNNEKNKLDFSESFQNYALNLESLLTSSSEYDRSLPRNCAERIFFKWLKETGALRFQEESEKKNSSQVEKRFVEEFSDLYNKVVVYIGEIEMQGSNLASNENSFNEVYINVPTSNGSTPTILFKTISDKNYNEDTVVVSENNSEYINGREESINPTSAGLTIEAIYDQDVRYASLKYNTNGNDGTVWYEAKASNGPNAYYTDTTFDDPSNDTIYREKSDSSDQMQYNRSRLDGISIDFDLSDYKEISDYNSKNQEDEIVTFNQFNTLSSAENFDFNAILLYYDVYDPDNIEDNTTNLYGILFLNDMVSTGTLTSKFKTINKIRQDNFISQQGNGFGIKLNFKFDVSTNLVDKRVEISVNDYNTLSMQLFLEAINKMVLMNRDYEKLLLMNKELLSQVQYYHEMIENSSDVSLLIEKFKQLTEENTLSTEAESINSNIADLQLQIKNILQGKTNVEVSYLMSLNPQDGVMADFKENKLRIGSSRQRYYSTQTVNFDVSKTNVDYITNEVKLGKFDNLVIHENNYTEKFAENNLCIRIDDTDYAWQNNQSMKILFQDPIHFDGKGILIYTDASDRNNSGLPYGQLVGIIDAIAPENTNPVIEIICIDAETNKFIVTCK